MKELHKQFDAARAEYQAVEYPGNLANDLFPSHRNIRRFILAGCFSAMAAAIALLFMLHRPVVTPTKSVAIQPHLTATTVPTDQNLLEFPQNIQLVPEYQVISIPSMPAFPSWSAGDETKSSTTQEAT